MATVTLELTREQIELLAYLVKEVSTFDENCIPIKPYKEAGKQLVNHPVLDQVYRELQGKKLIFEKDDIGTLYEQDTQEFRHIREFTEEEITSPEFTAKYPGHSIPNLLHIKRQGCIPYPTEEEDWDELEDVPVKYPLEMDEHLRRVWDDHINDLDVQIELGDQGMVEKAKIYLLQSETGNPDEYLKTQIENMFLGTVLRSYLYQAKILDSLMEEFWEEMELEIPL